jgi:23S rRNA (cytidine1920-2'-O)/16S rRNA (cytidine1409-2'-O)-methyltransferase
VIRGLFSSRSRARDAVLRGTVVINGLPAVKASQGIYPSDVITVDDPAGRYVSRAALKLVAALDQFDLSPSGKFCFDIGASTGGFTQVLLERGARHVVALDVGHGQLHESLMNEPRVTHMEGVNARDLSDLQFAEAPAFIVIDVSFIPLAIALPSALALASAGADLVALIKPQFEVGRDGVARGGIVRDEALQQKACDDVHAFLTQRGWHPKPVLASPIDGGDGNREFLVAAKKL